MRNPREFTFDSPQGIDEVIRYSLDTGGYGTATNPIVSVYQGIGADAVDIGGSALSGTPSITEGILTFPAFTPPALGFYRFEVAFDVSGNHIELFGILPVER